MDDLRVDPGPGLPHGLVVPAAELTERFSHSSGPGGQGVNTADSRVQLSWDIGASAALTDGQRRMLRERLGGRLLGGSVLAVEVSQERSQRRNRAIARLRLAGLVRENMVPVVPRRATRPTRGSQRRRLEGKRQRSETKRARRRPTPD